MDDMLPLRYSPYALDFAPAESVSQHLWWRARKSLAEPALGRIADYMLLESAARKPSLWESFQQPGRWDSNGVSCDTRIVPSVFPSGSTEQIVRQSPAAPRMDAEAEQNQLIR